MTWYATEREKEVNSPTLWCLNQQAPRTDRKSSQNESTPWLIIGWTEKGMQVTLVAWLEEIVGEEKKAKWWARPFSTKMIPFRQRKFWGQKTVDKEVGLQSKAPGGPCKKHRTESLDRSQQKGWFSRFWGDVTRPWENGTWEVSPIEDKYNLNSFSFYPS